MHLNDSASHEDSPSVNPGICSRLVGPDPSRGLFWKHQCGVLEAISGQSAEVVGAALLASARAQGMVPCRVLSGTTRDDPKLRLHLVVRGRSRNEALAQELFEHRFDVLEALQVEAWLKVRAKFAKLTPQDSAAGPVDDLLPSERRRLEFQKFRFRELTAADRAG